MKNKTIITLSVGMLFLALTGGASAQTYYPGLGYTYQDSSSCVYLSRDLSYGDRSTDVTTLQRFLVTRNYPGGGSWMITGYYGLATQTAVRNFQAESGIAQTGTVGIQTRLAIQKATCGTGLSYTTPGYTTPTYTPSYTTPAYTNYNYSNYSSYYPYGVSSTYPYTPNVYQTPTYQQTGIGINYITPTSGGPGTSVSVVGYGFTSDNNTVYFGNAVITNLRSSTGTGLSFVIPSTLTGFGSQDIQIGTYNVSVANSRGERSGNLQFNVTNTNTQGLVPQLTNLTGPTSVSTGVSNTYSATVNTVGSAPFTTTINWGDGSVNTTSTTYNHGVQTQNFSHVYTAAGTYTMVATVSNNSGVSATRTLTVVATGTSTGYNQPLSLTALSPAQGNIGSTVTIFGTGFTPTGNTVRFGNGGKINVNSTNNGTILTYTIPNTVSTCDLIGSSCGAPSVAVTPGTYQISVSNAFGLSNTLQYTVY